MNSPKLIFRDGELDIIQEYTKYDLIKNCLTDGYEMIYLDRFDKNSFINLVEKNYNIETLNLADFLMAPEDELINIFKSIAENCNFRSSEQLVRDFEFLRC